MRDLIEQVFHEVADLSADDRARYFDEHDIESEIRSEVTALLEFDAGSTLSLGCDIFEVAQGAMARFKFEAMLCGPYRLRSLLGSGGMGSVYLAERVDGEVTQRAAIKLLRPGLDSSQLRERFLAERQILANLSHPNIARLLDAGHREDGQPYLVMEYIEGKRIDIYTSELSIRAKVRLFVKVCAAVAYLHRNLVVHRDLKPANLLVTTEGEPKLLDFGIAKMLDWMNDPAATGMLMLTPDYASPEQVAGRPASTAADIYSLGAVLYKLLTGCSPHHFKDESAQEVVSAISAGKITPPAKLVPALRGDLEFILLKALRREPQERYATVDQFSEDLENYLESRTIRARKGDTWYQVRKFLRRRWLPIAAAALAIAGLSGGVLVADRQRAIAQQSFLQVRQLADRFVELHDDVAPLPGSTRVREKMVATALNYLDNLSQGADNDPKLLSEIGQVYEKVAVAQDAPGQPNLGRAQDALQSYRKAIAFESRAAALDPLYRADVAAFQSELAYLSMLNGRLPEARKNLDAAAALLDQLRKEKPDNVDLLLLAAHVATNRGDLGGFEAAPDDGLPFFQEASRIYFEYLRLKPSDDARVRAYRAAILVAAELKDNKRYKEALEIIHERAPIVDGLLNAEPENPNFLRQRMAAANYEGEIYDDEAGNCLGKPLEAIAALRRYMDIARKLVDMDPNNASARLSLAIAHYKLSWPLGKTNPPEALRMAKEAVRLFDQDLARHPSDRLLRSRRTYALRYLAHAYQRNHRLPEAVAAIKQAIATQQQLVLEAPADGHERNELALSLKVLAGFGNALVD